MKFINLLCWLCIFVAVVIMACGAIDFMFYGWKGGFLGVKHTTTFFLVANSFLLLSIGLRLLDNSYKLKSE